MPNNKSAPEQYPPPPAIATVSSIVPTAPPPEYQEVLPNNNNNTANYNTRNRNVPNPPPASTSAFEKTSLSIFMTSAGTWLFMLVMMCIPLVQLVMGAIFAKECPVQRNIPIYLTVAGVLGLLISFRILAEDIYVKAKAGTPGFDPSKTGFSKLNFTYFVMAGFFIVGNVWVFSTKDWVSTPESDKSYCNPIVYYFAYWSIISIYIIYGILFIGVIAYRKMEERAKAR